MGPPWGECRPSSVLPDKGHFILSSGDRTSYTEDGWERESQSLQHPTIVPYLPDIKGIPGDLSSQVGERVKRVGGYNLDMERCDIRTSIPLNGTTTLGEGSLIP